MIKVIPEQETPQVGYIAADPKVDLDWVEEEEVGITKMPFSSIEALLADSRVAEAKSKGRVMNIWLVLNSKLAWVVGEI